jgi:outer membrane protein insertion porin family
VAFKKGALYSQEDYYNTINNFYKVGVWESPSIDIIEKPDTNIVDVVIKLIPVKRYGFEGGLEVSYSSNSSTANIVSSTNSGNLLGVAANLSLIDRNLWHRAVRMTHTLRAGIELNTSQRNSLGTFINSNELSYTNTMFIPKLAWPLSIKTIKKLQAWRRKLINKQSFVNVSLAQINRIDFFNQQGLNLGYGFNFTKKTNASNVLRFFNLDFRRIYNTTERFDLTLDSFPFLRYSFNTALVTGMSFSRVYTYTNLKHPRRSNVTRFNIEESGLTWGALMKNLVGTKKDNFISKYLKEYIKADMEYVHTWSYARSALAVRGFGGLGIPLTRSDTTLPFFKQYYGGGSNSMRGWPVRGIGVGGQPLAPYNTRNFNDRTGDIQLESNLEYRFNYLRSPLFNIVSLKGALFSDIGNIWNVKNTKTDGSADTTQFPFFSKEPNKFTNFYKQLGVSAGTGIRLDFNYFVLRFDAGFRFKRPDITKNDGWQNPFKGDLFSHIFSTTEDNKRWRYENFNFTIGVDYPF